MLMLDAAPPPMPMRRAAQLDQQRAGGITSLCVRPASMLPIMMGL